ncbi:MAG: TadE/TadG family type IV pilus assembly protein [Burkholderiales bacterium]|jgi:Flp pilus assembly protein TadG
MNLARREPLQSVFFVTGVAAVEMALVLPVLCALSLGLMDLSLALYNKAILTNAAREGARAGIVLRNPKPGNAEIQQVVLGYTQGALINPGGGQTPVVTVVQSVPAAFPNPLRVTVTFSFQGFAAGALMQLFQTPLILSASAVMVNE